MKKEIYVTGDDGEKEWVCKHGVGHPVGPFPKGQEYRGTHTCCNDPECHEKLDKIRGRRK